ncbi:MAG: 5-(carboxyamino)imidazole ribonucleotide synthase, partial [Lysobacterales bacterium CG_4_9_14_3_um_filter_62_6]
LSEPRGYFHDYGKAARDGRKVGHATIMAEQPAQLADALGRVAAKLDRQHQIAPLLAML